MAVLFIIYKEIIDYEITRLFAWYTERICVKTKICLIFIFSFSL